MENENQDVALENNGVVEDQATEETTEELSSKKVRELEAELEKQKQIANRYKKKAEKKETVSSEEGKKEINTSDELIKKTYLRSADITDPDEIDLAFKLSEELNMSIDKLVDHKFFKAELEEIRTTKANEKATSNIRGGNTKSNAKLTPEYWANSETPPSPSDISDRKTRQKAVRAWLNSQKDGGKKFYND